MQVRKEISNQVQQSRGKFPDQPSVDHENSGKKAHKKKHRRRNSICGIPTASTMTVDISSSISSRPALSSKHRFGSTENLHRLSHTTEKDVSSSLYTHGGVTGSLVPSDKSTQHKPTIRRSNSFSDVRHQSSSSSSYYSDISARRYMPRTNQSSVRYNIITNNY